MAMPPIAPIHDSSANSRIPDKTRLVSLLVLLVLLVLCVVFSWTTRDAMAHLPFLNGHGRAASLAGNKTLVDLRPWQTAQALAPLAVTAEETEYAHQAEHLADHEVDQAFATALRQANLKAQQSTFTGEALALSQKVEQLKQLVAQDQAQVASMTSALSPLAAQRKPGNQPDVDSDDLEIAKAQLGLDSDVLTDTQHDLDRASGNNRAQIQSELSAHEESMRKYDSESSNGGEVAVLAVARRGTLARRVSGWFSQRTRYQLIMQALTQSQDDIRSLTGERNALEAKANANSAPTGAATDRASRLANLAGKTAERQLLNIYYDRIQTEQQLAAVYGKWSAQVLLQHRILVHLILQSLCLILFILICMVLADALVQRLMATPALGQRQRHTLRSILKLSIQVLGFLLILLVIFGTPQQMPTILGLATAGITIVLQDFILAFFGWFSLMGKDGIRVGDLVEINGVSGEVTEIGLIHTMLLETGNLTDKGLPTGRSISFMNSFAIRGQYFNFSTSGQWMWDEITVPLPASIDPRSMVERIQKAVLDETQEGAGIAVREWTHTGRSGNLSRFSTIPVVNLLPSATGFDAQVRYVTRASARFDVRIALYNRVFDLLREQNWPMQTEEKPGIVVA
ncbi:MAG TPA: mechanosensitive ion channel domain-containing protein [Terracidiphilus sp.]|nr:mechanosensitive ion channel domain-containing protein [Terracidiphilus sp.]